MKEEAHVRKNWPKRGGQARFLYALLREGTSRPSGFGLSVNRSLLALELILGFANLGCWDPS